MYNTDSATMTITSVILTNNKVVGDIESAEVGVVGVVGLGVDEETGPSGIVIVCVLLQ
jgi:hypothetical protein